MSGAGHTAWRVQPMRDTWSADGPGSFVTVAVGVKGRRAPIALVVEPGLSDATDDTVDRHARLIAAAPKLLEACLEFKEVIDRWTGPWGANMVRVSKLVDAAIAKATA